MNSIAAHPTLEDCRAIPPIAFGDPRGLLRTLLPEPLPFAVARAFTIESVPESAHRGAHAHTRCQELLFMLRGSAQATLDDGARRRTVRLSASEAGLLVPAMVWLTLSGFSSDALLLVLASEPYDSGEHVRDYEQFLRLRRQAPDFRISPPS